MTFLDSRHGLSDSRQQINIGVFPNADPKAFLEGAEKATLTETPNVRFKDTSSKLGKGRSTTYPHEDGRLLTLGYFAGKSRTVRVVAVYPPDAARDIEAALKKLRASLVEDA